MRNERRSKLKQVRTRQLLHAPSVIMVAITTVPVLIMWLRGEGNENSYAFYRSIVEALLFDGVFSVMLLIVFVCMCISLYCVLCDIADDANDSTLDYLWTRRRTRRKRRGK